MKPVSWPSAEKATSAVAAAKSGTARPTEPARRGDITITNQWNINGADDPRKVAAMIDSRFRQLVAQLEAEQRTAFND